MLLTNVVRNEGHHSGDEMKRSYIKRRFSLSKYRRSELHPIRKDKLRFFRYNKFGNKSMRCHQSHIHQSIGEARYCDSLAILEKAGEIKSYKSQQMFELIVNGKRITGHRVDFLVMTKNNGLEVHEVKGFATEVWNLKRKLFEALYSDIPYIVVKI